MDPVNWITTILAPSTALIADGLTVLQFFVQCVRGQFGESTKQEAERLAADLESRNARLAEVEDALRSLQRNLRDGGNAFVLGGRTGVEAHNATIRGGDSVYGSGGHAVVDGQQGGVVIVGGVIRGGDAGPKRNDG